MVNYFFIKVLVSLLVQCTDVNLITIIKCEISSDSFVAQVLYIEYNY